MVRRWLRRIGLTLGLLLLVVGIFALRLAPVWPGLSVPSATRLHIDNQPPTILPFIGCPTALLGPVVVTVEGQGLVFRRETGERVDVEFPPGWGAWLVGDLGVLIDRYGGVVALEGQTVSFGGGQAGESGERFRVCQGFA